MALGEDGDTHDLVRAQAYCEFVHPLDFQTLLVEVNNVLTFRFTLDTGASDVLIPADVALTPPERGQPRIPLNCRRT